MVIRGTVILNRKYEFMVEINKSCTSLKLSTNLNQFDNFSPLLRVKFLVNNVQLDFYIFEWFHLWVQVFTIVYSGTHNYYQKKKRHFKKTSTMKYII